MARHTGSELTLGAGQCSSGRGGGHGRREIAEADTEGPDVLLGSSVSVPRFPVPYPSKRRTGNELSEVSGPSHGAAQYKPHQYDVFINHRGADVKKTFVSHLDAALRTHGFRPFLDEKSIGMGCHVYESIEKALESTCVHVAIFSKRYAESEYCLDELCGMLRSGQKILPVFFDVSPDDLECIETPDDLACIKTNPFQKGFEDLQKKAVKNGWTEEIKEWKKALREVAKLKGYRLDEVNGNEHELIRRILKAVGRALPSIMDAGEQRYGMEGRLNEALNMLNRSSVLGVVGMGGIGKTTLAKKIHDHFLSLKQFKRYCFLEDVRSRSIREPSQLRRDFMEAMDRADDCDVTNTGDYKRVFDSLLSETVLLVMDDIDQKGQFEALIPDVRKLGSGSRIVITSRDRQVVTHAMAGAERWEVYEVPLLNEYDSRCLFNRYAFLDWKPIEDFADLAAKVADACGGHALSLETVGSSLLGKNRPEHKEMWSEAVKVLKESEDVFGKLRSTYEMLPTDGDRAMFLDVACMLIGMKKEMALTIWKSCESCSEGQCSTSKTPVSSLEKLMDRSLVRVDEQGMLRMHDVLRDMGREMVKRGGAKKERRRPEEWTHLWDAGLAAKVLSSAETNFRIRGLWLGDGERSGCASYLVSRLLVMKELHLLVLDGCYVDVGDKYSSWPEELRWLQWRRFRGGQLPSELKLPSLVVLDLSGSDQLTRLWEDDADIQLPVLQLLILSTCTSLVELAENFGQSVPKLKRLEMGWCSSVMRLPDSIRLLTDLELLNLSFCARLVSLPDAVAGLASLTTLILKKCYKLVSLPDAVVGLARLKTLVLEECHSLQQLPEKIGNLTSLETLNLADCSSLSYLPASIGGLKMLRRLVGIFTTIKDLPAGFVLLTSLTSLYMDGVCSFAPGTFHGLQALTDLRLDDASADMGGLESLTALKYLVLWRHETITAVPKSFGKLKWLVRLDMSYSRELLTVEALPEGLERLVLCKCTALTEIPSLAGMKSLVHLDLYSCRSLRHVRGLECLTMLEYVDVSKCISLDGHGSRIMGCRALRVCRVGGSKIGVAYENTWLEGGPSEQVITWMGNAIPLLTNGMVKPLRTNAEVKELEELGWVLTNYMVKEVVELRFDTSSLVLECVIASNAKCMSLILCFVLKSEQMRSDAIKVKVFRGGRLVVVSIIDYWLNIKGDNQVCLCTLGRENQVVRSLQHGDQICVYLGGDSHSGYWRVMEGAICVVFKEDKNRILMMNSQVLEMKESQDMVLRLGKLVLEDDGNLQPTSVVASEVEADDMVEE